jgi:hypothetical protein
VKQPVRERRCIFEDVCFVAEDVFGTDMVADVLLEGVEILLAVDIILKLKKY